MQTSVVNYKKVCAMTEDFRLDADYYKPNYLKEDRQRAHLNNIKIGEFCYVTDGQHGYHEVDESSPIFHLTAKNARGWFANTENADRLAKWVDDKNKRSSLKEGDLILSTRGTVGLCAIVEKEVLPANIDQDVARIALNIKSKICPEFLLVYLNSKFGQDWLIRNTSGMVQQGLSLDKVRNIPIPLLSTNFQALSKSMVIKSYDLLKHSKTLYSQAEQILLSDLNLAGWEPKHQLSFVKNYSDTQNSLRIDAEYFQPMYEEIEEAIKNYSGGYSLIKDEFKQNRSTFKVDDQKEYAYVEIGSVNVSNGEIIPLKLHGSQLPANAKRVLKKGDVIISKVRTYRGAITIIEKDGYVGSSAFTVLREKGHINKETLSVFLNSKPLLSWSLKPNTGTSYPVIIDEDILNLPIPTLPQAKQKKIAETVNKSFCNRELLKQLLDIAKRGVEMAIEKDENTAQKWICSDLSKIGVKL